MKMEIILISIIVIAVAAYVTSYFMKKSIIKR